MFVCYDPLSHLTIEASSCMKLMHTRTDFKLNFRFCSLLLKEAYATMLESAEFIRLRAAYREAFWEELSRLI